MATKLPPFVRTITPVLSVVRSERTRSPAGDRTVGGPVPTGTPAAGRRTARCWALAASVVSLIPPFSFPGLVSALLAALRPTRTTLAVAGTVGIVAGLLALRGSVGHVDSLLEPAPLIAQAAVGLVLLWLARGEPATARVGADPAASTLAVLAGLLILDLAGFVLRLPSPLPLTDLHLWARHDAGLVAVLAAMAVLGLTWRPRKAAFTILAALVAGLSLGVGTGAFRDRFSEDPLRLDEDGARPDRAAGVRVLRPRLLDTRWVNSRVIDLRLAPSGRRLATATLPTAGGHASTGSRHGFLVDRGDGPSRFVEALDLAFLNDDRVLLLVKGSRQGLRLRPLGPDLRRPVGPEIGLPSLVSPRLQVEFHRGRWTVTGIREEGTIGVRLSGKLGEPGYTETVWAAPPAGAAHLAQVAVGPEPRALAITTRDRVPGLAPAARLLYPSSDDLSVSELVLIEASSGVRLTRTTTRVRCEAVPRYSAFLCVAIDGEPTSRLWMVDPISGQFDLVARLPGTYQGPIIVSGARVLLNGPGRPVIVDLATRRAWALELGVDVADRRAIEPTRVSAPGLTSPAFAATDEPGPALVTLQGDILAASSPEGDGSRIRIFRLPRH